MHPERCVIGHPFNPPHIVSLVEVVGGAKTSEATIERAMEGLGDGPEAVARGWNAAADNTGMREPRHFPGVKLASS